MPPDPRDEALVEQVVASVRGLIRAVHRNEPQRVLDELRVLVTAIIDHRDATMAERPSDEPLRAAVAMLARPNL